MRVSTVQARNSRAPSAKFARDFFLFTSGSDFFFLFARESHLQVCVAQFTPFSFPLIFSRKKGVACMNKRETVEDFRSESSGTHKRFSTR